MTSQLINLDCGYWQDLRSKQKGYDITGTFKSREVALQAYPRIGNPKLGMFSRLKLTIERWMMVLWEKQQQQLPCRMWVIMDQDSSGYHYHVTITSSCFLIVSHHLWSFSSLSHQCLISHQFSLCQKRAIMYTPSLIIHHSSSIQSIVHEYSSLIIVLILFTPSPLPGSHDSAASVE